MSVRSPTRSRNDFVITRMITDRIGLHSILLPVLIIWMETFWHLCTIFQNRGQNPEDNHESAKKELEVRIFSSRFCTPLYDYRPNRTPLIPRTGISLMIETLRHLFIIFQKRDERAKKQYKQEVCIFSWNTSFLEWSTLYLNNTLNRALLPNFELRYAVQFFAVRRCTVLFSVMYCGGAFLIISITSL